MAAPLSSINDYLAAQRGAERDELQVDADTCIQDMANIYQAAAYAMESISDKAKRHGLAALLARMPQDVAENFTASLAMIRQVWPALSDKPCPATPDLPEHEPEPEPSEVQP